MIKLSIIIPCYNAEPYISELIACLTKQATDETEIIVVDDGSRTPFTTGSSAVKVIRKENGGVSSARNRGIEEAQGEYIAFIDADDLVSDSYVSRIINKIDTEHFDYMYLSWKTFGGGWVYDVKLKSVAEKFPTFNLCVWNRVYKRSVIGTIRFNERKKIAEDAEFIRMVKEEGKKKAYIDDYMYFYRTGHGGNLTERFSKGELDFERIVFYYPEIKRGDQEKLEAIKEACRDDNEVIVMCDRCEEHITDCAMLVKPQRIMGTELRGEKTDLFVPLPKPIKTQVVIYIGNSQQIGGIETFIYNFCKVMCEYYDIRVVYTEHMDPKQIMRLAKYVPVSRNNINRSIICDTVINIRITDTLPTNIRYKKWVQMVHTCQMADSGIYHYTIVKGWDEIVFVSEAAAESFKEQVSDYNVIGNITDSEKPKKPLLLISATRLTYEKGEERMNILAEKLNAENIPFLWLVFAPVSLKKVPQNVVQCPTTLDIRSFYEKADYVVQLSDKESFCYTLVEALEMGVPVLTTPIEVLSEIGFEDKKNGYILPYDMKDIDVKEIYNKIPKFKPKKNKNDELVKQWRKLLGDTTPEHTYKMDEEFIDVMVTRDYGDIELGREMAAGDIVKMRRDRAIMLINRGFVEKI